MQEGLFDNAPFKFRLANCLQMQERYKGYATCLRCHQPWFAGVTPKIVDIPNNGGMFALCLSCWNELTPEQRVVYYEALYWSWGGRDYPVSLVEEAVKNA